ncbi:hypothetical protein [Bdellovibrio sp. HCB2-146]|uniref:hypothetical protein n=1 Tax=Bdellovibrio sp. HCB2-146 TaxID=3394362 RepID=UPI0039BCD512
MKRLVLALMMMGVSSLTLTAQANTVCEAKAEAAVAKFVAEADYYDKDGFDAIECVLAPNKKAILCDVAANKGDGAATDSYLVVLNESCTRTYRVQLTGEE